MTQENLKHLLEQPHNVYQCRNYYNAYQHYFNNPKIKYCNCPSECSGWYKKARTEYLRLLNTESLNNEN